MLKGDRRGGFLELVLRYWDQHNHGNILYQLQLLRVAWSLAACAHRLASRDSFGRIGRLRYLNKASAAVAAYICIVGLGEMPVEAGRVELGQAVDFIDIGVDAVGDRDVNQTVVRPQGNSRLRPLFGQRVQPRACSPSEDDPKHSL